MKRILYTALTIFLILGFFTDASAQFNIEKKKNFAMDALCFKSDIDSIGRTDIFILVPYESLSFKLREDSYYAKFLLELSLFDSLGNKIGSKTFKKQILADKYFEAQGGSGNFVSITHSFETKAGKYEVLAKLEDKFSSINSEESRTVNIVDFSAYPFSMSGVLLVSSIEEIAGRYRITPHISDNIGNLRSGFFLFFETYNFNGPDSADFVYEFRSKTGELIYKSPKIRDKNINNSGRHYIKINLPEAFPPGEYILKLLALKHDAPDNYSEVDFLAGAERSIKNYRKISGFLVDDIDKAIERLIFVADSDIIDAMTEEESSSKKQDMFDKFWKNLDPTPHTERNEAMQEYFGRIFVADKMFKSHTGGWRSDMGMTFIILGNPINKNQRRSSNGMSLYEVWTYSNQQEIIFVDRSGMDDFRFSQSAWLPDKYRYEK